jgi:CheY-like chemotaxis protein
MEVVAVSDGDEALRVLEEQRPDILLADVWMPGASGYELCERVKGDERLRHTPVVLLVGAFEPFNEAEARRVGADTVLTKPFQSIRDLVSKVGSLLGGGGPKPEEAPAEQPRGGEPAGAAPAAGGEAPERRAAAAAFVAAPEEQDATFRPDPETSFADLGADDELIEAKPAESFGGAARDAYSPQRRRPPAPEGRRPAATFESAHAEAKGHAAAREEFEVSEHTEEFETSAHAPDAFTGQRAAAGEPVGTNGRAASAHGSFAARAAGAAAADDALLDLGHYEPPAPGAAAEADDFILDLEDDRLAAGFQPGAAGAHARPDVPGAFAEAAHGAPAPSFDEPASSFGEPAQSFGQFDFSAQPAAPAQGHDASASEFMMQEEPQFSGTPARAREAGAASRGFFEPSVAPDAEPAPATFESEYTDGSVEGDVPKPPEPSTAGYSVGESRAGVEEPLGAGQLSREAVDAIARRVVELMSDKVVREIAWEVVPELAELLIKQKLDEERQK